MARSFNGSSDVISPPTLPGITASLTISLWFNLSGSPGAYPNGYLMFGTGALGMVNYAVLLDTGVNNALLFQYTTSSNVFVTLSIPYTYDTGVWHNAVISTDFTSAGTHIYLDGVAGSVSTSGTPGTPNNTNTWTRIGTVFTVGSNQDYYKGLLADVALWNTALSSSDAAKLATGYRPVDVNSANLQNWWPLSGYSSPEPDIQGGQNGVLTGTSQAAMPPSLGRGGRLFTKANHEFVTLTLPTLSSVGSISLWFNNTSSPGTYPNGLLWFWCGNNVSANGNYFAGIDSGAPSKIQFTYTVSGTQVTFAGATYTFDTGVWHNVVISTDFTLAGTHMYLDGTALTVTNPSGTPGTPDHVNNDGRLGVYVPGGLANYYDGKMADVAVWTTQLSSSDAAKIAGGVRPNSVQGGSLAGWWPLDGFSNSTEPDRSGGGNNGALTGTLPILGPPQLWRLSA